MTKKELLSAQVTVHGDTIFLDAVASISRLHYVYPGINDDCYFTVSLKNGQEYNFHSSYFGNLKTYRERLISSVCKVKGEKRD